MSSELLPKSSSPTPAGVITETDLCDGGVANASNEVHLELIHATAAFSGGQQISVRRSRNETPAEPLRQAIARWYKVDSNVANLVHDATSETPAYQIRQEIARRLNVDSESVVLMKGATEVDDSNPDESGPFYYVLKAPNEDRSRELMRMIVAGNQCVIDRSKEQLREAESQLRLNLLLNRSSTATLPPLQHACDS